MRPNRHSRLSSILTTRNKLTSKLILAALLCGLPLLVWNLQGVSGEERQYLGKWFDAKPDGEPIIIELHANRRVTRTVGLQSSELGHWRYDNSRIEIYTRLAWPCRRAGVIPLFTHVWNRAKSIVMGSGQTTSPVFHYFTPQQACDGSIILNEVLLFGCFDRPTEDEFFTRSLSAAEQRDEAFRRNDGPRQPPLGASELLAFGCPT